MSPFLAACVSSGGALILLLVIHWFGQWLSATHPEPKAVEARNANGEQQVSEAVAGGPLAAVIAAAVHTVLKRPVKVVSISPLRPPSVETLMLQWSVEGRRAIYSSHRLR